MKERLVVEKLRRDHAVQGFDCGDQPLNRYLIRYALQSQQSGASQCWLGLSGATVVGFYALVVGEIAPGAAPERLAKGMPRHPIPLMILARLAVDLRWQGRGLGAGLLKDALRRTEQAADIAGIRAIAVHAKDDGAASFYARFGYIPSSTDLRHLFLLMKDVRRIIGGDV